MERIVLYRSKVIFTCPHTGVEWEILFPCMPCPYDACYVCACVCTVHPSQHLIYMSRAGSPCA